MLRVVFAGWAAGGGRHRWVALRRARSRHAVSFVIQATVLRAWRAHRIRAAQTRRSQRVAFLAHFRVRPQVFYANRCLLVAVLCCWYLWGHFRLPWNYVEKSRRAFH